jgi:hypothetical protein
MRAFRTSLDVQRGSAHPRVAKRQFLPLGVASEREFLTGRLELLSDFLLETTGQELMWDWE